MQQIDIVKVSDPISNSLVDVARNTLQMFSLAASRALTTVPNWNEVKCFMKSLSSSPSKVYTEDFFKKPLYPVVRLVDVAKILWLSSDR